MANGHEQRRSIHQRVAIPVGKTVLQGDLSGPESASGIVLFAHGSGSSRHSPRNQYVARVLQEAGLATLLMDLLTVEEESFDAQTATLRFDIELLARRLTEVTWWVVDQKQTAKLPIGFFGASTGAAAALVSAAEIPALISTIVARGGRPDLAGEALRQVVAPTLLIVGGDDRTVLELNRSALAMMPGKKALEIVPSASHLFEEPGALESVAGLARQWFLRYMNRRGEQNQAA
jgi:dienelactone hydrolase